MKNNVKSNYVKNFKGKINKKCQKLLHDIKIF